MSALLKRYRYAGRRRGVFALPPATDPWAGQPLFTGWEAWL